MLSLIVLIAVVVASIFLAQKYGVRRVNADASVLAGVCGGLARTLNLPPLAVRIAYVGLCIISGGIGLAVYLSLALSLPRE